MIDVDCLESTNHKVKLVRGVTENLGVWEQFIDSLMVRVCSWMIILSQLIPCNFIYKDEPEILCYGTVFQKSWFSVVWNESLSDVNITNCGSK